MTTNTDLLSGFLFGLAKEAERKAEAPATEEVGAEQTQERDAETATATVEVGEAVEHREVTTQVDRRSEIEHKDALIAELESEVAQLSSKL